MEARDHKITKEQRDEYVERVTQEALNKSQVRSFRFHSDQVKEMLNQNGAVEFVAEKGFDEKGMEVLVLHCKDEGKNILPVILEIAFPCPPFCN